MRRMGYIDRSSLNESEYPHLTRIIDMACRDKPLQVGNTWPTLVKGKMSLLVPDGGQCFGCKTDLSGRVANFVCRSENKEFDFGGYEAVVFARVKDNICCVNITCIQKTVDKDKEEWRGGQAFLEEVKKVAKSAKYCDQCLKSSLNTHRCYSCHSAQYCSEECRVKDLAWHKTVCETWAKDETRKMPDRKEQKNKAKKRLKDLDKMICNRPDCNRWRVDWDKWGVERCKTCNEVRSFNHYLIHKNVTVVL